MRKRNLNFILLILLIFTVIALLYALIALGLNHSFVDDLAKTEVTARYNQRLSDIYEPIRVINSIVNDHIEEKDRLTSEGAKDIVSIFDQNNFNIASLYINAGNESFYYIEDEMTGNLERTDDFSVVPMYPLSDNGVYRTFHGYKMFFKVVEKHEETYFSVFLTGSEAVSNHFINFDLTLESMREYVSSYLSAGEDYAIYDRDNQLVLSSNEAAISYLENTRPYDVTLMSNGDTYQYVEVISDGFQYEFLVDEYVVKNKYILFLLIMNLLISIMIAFIIQSVVTGSRKNEENMHLASNALENMTLGDTKNDFNFPMSEISEVQRLFNAIEDVRFKMVTMKMVNQTSENLLDIHELLMVGSKYDQFFNELHEYLINFYDIDFAVQIMSNSNISQEDSIFKYVKFQEFSSKLDQVIHINTLSQWKEISINNVSNINKMLREKSSSALDDVKSIQVLPVYLDKKHCGIYIIGSFSANTRLTKIETRFFRTLLNTMELKYSWNVQHNSIISENHNLKKVNERLRMQVQRIQSESITDPVSGLYKKHHVIEALTETLMQYEDSQNIALGIIDVDNFNVIIDKYGHYASENLLKKLGTIVMNHMSPYDYAGRYASDVLLVVMHEDELSAIKDTFERIRLLVSSSSYDSINQSVTISIGLTMLNGSDTRHSVVRRAEELLDDAKHLGRNKVCYDFEY